MEREKTFRKSSSQAGSKLLASAGVVFIRLTTALRPVLPSHKNVSKKAGRFETLDPHPLWAKRILPLFVEHKKNWEIFLVLVRCPRKKLAISTWACRIKNGTTKNWTSMVNIYWPFPANMQETYAKTSEDWSRWCSCLATCHKRWSDVFPEWFHADIGLSLCILLKSMHGGG